MKGGELIQVEVPKSSAHNMQSVIQVCLFSVLSSSGAWLPEAESPSRGWNAGPNPRRRRRKPGDYRHRCVSFLCVHEDKLPSSRFHARYFRSRLLLSIGVLCLVLLTSCDSSQWRALQMPGSSRHESGRHHVRLRTRSSFCRYCPLLISCVGKCEERTCRRGSGGLYSSGSLSPRSGSLNVARRAALKGTHARRACEDRRWSCWSPGGH